MVRAVVERFALAQALPIGLAIDWGPGMAAWDVVDVVGADSMGQVTKDIEAMLWPP